MKHYDIIGDIHGHADELVALLEKMNYRKKDGFYQHPDRQVIFLGDFIDRGPKQREVIETVRPMIDSGTALAVMGNHEFNAICYATRKKDGDFIRPHDKAKNKQHGVFLNAYPFQSAEYDDVIEWFKTLPAYLDLGDIRIVHACWDQKSLTALDPYIDANRTFKAEGYQGYADKTSAVYHAIETVLKGPEQALPKDLHFADKDGHTRKAARIQWWTDHSQPPHLRLHFAGAALSPAQKNLLQNIQIDRKFDLSGSPVFFGHYWLKGEPKVFNQKFVCVDYSVAKDGKLVAYRWQGEQKLKKQNFIC